MTQIENAKITSTHLGFEDHGILTASLFLETERGSVGFGGYQFDKPGPDGTRVANSAFGVDFILRVLAIADVERWEQLKGRYVRIECREDGRVRRIGHYLKNEWFDVAALSAQYRVPPS